MAELEISSLTGQGTLVEDMPAADDVLAEDDVLVEDDLLVEDVSIDGMCGVY